MIQAGGSSEAEAASKKAKKTSVSPIQPTRRSSSRSSSAHNSSTNLAQQRLQSQEQTPRRSPRAGAATKATAEATKAASKAKPPSRTSSSRGTVISDTDSEDVLRPAPKATPKAAAGRRVVSDTDS